jgi:hypothetical protein
MLIMSLLVLNIGSIQYVMNLLANVLNALNEFVRLGSFRLDMSQISMVVANGMAMSMGHSGWNPKPT